MTHQDIMDDLRAHIIEQASLSPAYLLLRSIPGVGELTAAIILSEIGDVLRFPSAKQLVAFSGLDPSVFESGKFKSTNNKVSKRGSSYLHTALYQATVAGIAKRKGRPINPVLFEFYSKRISEGKSSKVALLLLHVINFYALFMVLGKASSLLSMTINYILTLIYIKPSNLLNSIKLTLFPEVLLYRSNRLALLCTFLPSEIYFSKYLTPLSWFSCKK